MPDDDSLEARLKRLEDLAEIERLITDYRHHLDARDLHAYSRLFCADGEWSGNTGHAQGPDAIQAMLEERLSPNPPAPGPTSWHVVANPMIDLDGDSATASVTWALIRRGEGDQPELALLGHYDDVLAREDGRWRFKSRRAEIDIPHRPAPRPASQPAVGPASQPASQPGAPEPVR
jgi:ketosteroid isomerase-like protein